MVNGLNDKGQERISAPTLLVTKTRGDSLLGLER